MFQCICVYFFVWHQKLCSSHCQSQISNDTNSPCALTISTLTALTLSSQHTHTHTHTRTNTSISYALKRSLTHLLAHSHTRMKESSSQPKGGSTTRNVAIRNKTRQRRIADASDQSRYRALLYELYYEYIYLSECVCVCLRL